MNTVIAQPATQTYRQVLVKMILALPLIYGVLWLISRVVMGYWIDPSLIIDGPINGIYALKFAFAFFLFFTPLLYLVPCMLAKKWLRPQPVKLILYLGATCMGGVFGEIVVGSLAKVLFHVSLWRYEYLPKHSNFTSGVGLILWPMYGFYLYFFHQAMHIRGSLIPSHVSLSGLFIAVDALVLEVLANTFSLTFSGSYLFKYHAGDLLHMSTVQIFVPYVAFGVLGAWILKTFSQEKFPRVFLACVFYLCGLGLVLLG